MNKHEFATDGYTLLPTIVVDRVNFMAELPQEVHKIRSVKRNESNELAFTELDWLQYQKYKSPYREYFTRDGNKIYFSGGFSRWWVIRVFQKWYDRRCPIKYKVEYVTAKIAKQLL